MKKILSIMLCSATVAASAQISVSARANLLFRTDKPTWESISTTASEAYKTEGKNSAGYNVGLYAKIDLPVTSLFVMPEIYYSTFKTELDVGNTKLEAKSNRVDVPVLLGFNLLGETASAFIGPVASYNLASEEQYNDFRENAMNNFTLGYQFGAQVQLSKLILNARYEGAFSEDQREFINTTGQTIRYDSRPSLFIVGLGYRF